MSDKFAPIQMPDRNKRFRVPWRIHMKAWEQYDRLGHGDQSAERIAERGGFGLEELILLLAGENPWRISNEEIQKWETPR